MGKGSKVFLGDALLFLLLRLDFRLRLVGPFIILITHANRQFYLQTILKCFMILFAINRAFHAHVPTLELLSMDQLSTPPSHPRRAPGISRHRRCDTPPRRYQPRRPSAAQPSFSPSVLLSLVFRQNFDLISGQLLARLTQPDAGCEFGLHTADVVPHDAAALVAACDHASVVVAVLAGAIFDWCYWSGVLGVGSGVASLGRPR